MGTIADAGRSRRAARKYENNCRRAMQPKALLPKHRQDAPWHAGPPAGRQASWVAAYSTQKATSSMLVLIWKDSTTTTTTTSNTTTNPVVQHPASAWPPRAPQDAWILVGAPSAPRASILVSTPHEKLSMAKVSG